MTKNDLRVGYIAVLRNGAEYMVMPMAGEDGEKMVFSNLNDINSYKSFSKYDNDLTNLKNSNYDVVKVYGLSSRISGLSIDTDDRELLFDRSGDNSDNTEEDDLSDEDSIDDDPEDYTNDWDNDDSGDNNGEENCIHTVSAADDNTTADDNTVRTMSDLRAGYMVILNNGNIYMVMPSNNGLVLAHKDGHYIKSFWKYNDDMTNKKNSKYNIAEVYGYPSGDTSPFNLDTEKRIRLR